MSTVLLTTTHIGSDHTVVRATQPNSTKVEINHKKLFVSKDNTFVVGIVGNFYPEKVEYSEAFNLIEYLFKTSIDEFPKHDYDIRKIDDARFIEIYLSVFDDDCRIMVANKLHRFSIYYSKLFKQIFIRQLGDIFGIGAGGSIGVGMLVGGVSIEDVWDKLNLMDSFTSQEHTIIPLSSLSDWDETS